MRVLTLLYLIILSGCATKYVVPGNRFMTPESQGGVFRGQFELQSTSGQVAKLKTDNERVGQGVEYERIPRTGYQFSTSFFDPFDFVWAHTASSTSMVGGKLQLLGTSRTGNATGHKFSVAYLAGGNRHSTRSKSVQLRADSHEFLLIYGYRISDLLLTYFSFSRANYTYKIQLGPPAYPTPPLAGAIDEVKSIVDSLNLGGELNYQIFFAKAECSYQKIDSTETPVKNALTFGFAGGLSW